MIHVITHAMMGHTIKVTAFELGVTAKTVEQHRYNALRQLHAANMADAVRIIFRLGSIEDAVEAANLALTAR
jgi:DNA-binding NarL/FixJ family response regulator